MRIFVFLACMLCMGMVWANEEYVTGVGGRVTVMKGEHAQIRMVREWVKIDIHPGYYDTAVQFVFHNDGPATTVQMGFPEAGQGLSAYRRRTAFRSFQASVDGHAITATRQRATETPGDDSYSTFWVKSVSFAANQTRTVRVEYRSIPGELGDEIAWVLYDFTGGNWKGTVDESMLTIILHLQGVYAVQSSTPLLRKGNVFSARWENWQAQHSLDFRYMPTYANALALRGGPKIYGWDWHESTISIAPLSEGNGKTGTLWASPAVFCDDGKTACIALAALRDYLDPNAPYSTGPRLCLLQWNAKTQTATLTYQGRTVSVTVGSKALKTPDGEITMTTAPFLGEPVLVYGERTRFLYAPADELVKALGGTATLDREKRELLLAFPKVESEVEA